SMGMVRPWLVPRRGRSWWSHRGLRLPYWRRVISRRFMSRRRGSNCLVFKGLKNMDFLVIYGRNAAFRRFPAGSAWRISPRSLYSAATTPPTPLYDAHHGGLLFWRGG